MNKHIGGRNSLLRYTILPRQPGFTGEHNWGSDWVKWCEKNCAGFFGHMCDPQPDFKTYFRFENKEDAFRFKVIWG